MVTNLRVNLAILFASTLVTIANWITSSIKSDSPGWVAASGIAAAAILTGFSVGPLTSWVLRSRWVRKLLQGEDDLEGYWLFQSHADQNEGVIAGFPLGAPVMIRIYFHGGKYLVTATRIDDDGLAFYTHSTAALIDFSRGHYLNLARVALNSRTIPGIAVGEFFRSVCGKGFDRYEGNFSFIEESVRIRQTGRRIADAEVQTDEMVATLLRRASQEGE